MRVLVACEISGRVRDEFLRLGHDAVSCDLEPSLTPGPHITGRVEDVLDDDWDLVVAFPPCTYLSNANAPCIAGKCPHEAHDAEWREWRHIETINAALLFHACRNAGRMSAVENPRPNTIAIPLLGRHSAVTQPFWFGDPWMKHTCWWLRGVTPLQPTNPVAPTHRIVNSGRRRTQKQTETIPGFDPTPPPRTNSLPGLHTKPHLRSLTPPGQAKAIAQQWSQPNQSLPI